MTKKMLLTIIALGAAISLVGLGVNSVLAEDGVYPTIVSRLAEEFNLHEDDVEAVFEAVRDEHLQEMIENREDRLSQAVGDGVITEEQKQALINKWEEMSEHRLEHHEEMQAWFKQQGIDHEAIMEYGGFGHMRLGKMHMGM